MPPLQVWFMTTGEAGYRTQARGLARALAETPREWVIDLRPPWRWLPGVLAAPFALGGLDSARDRPQPPWPDVLITCGRRATAVSIAIRRASRGRTATVHIQNPLTRLAAFDLVVAMDHDRIAGPNVLSVPTALHDVTPERLAAAAGIWRARLAPDGHPLIGVLLGGSTKSQPFTVDQAARLLEGLARVRAATGARLAVTPSRRTPAPVRDLFIQRLADDPGAYVWDGEGDNPYLGILALSERLVVTSDSVSMVSEALATVAGVELFGADGGRKQADFVRGLIGKGLARRFEGDPAPQPTRAPVNATGAAAQAVRRMLAARTGVSG
jgi:mitochondrial fission protein ELM1